MNDKSKQTIKKLNGVFYTPPEIVSFLSDWATSSQKAVDFLEPSAGDGRFAKKIIENDTGAKVTAVEIDSKECEKIEKLNNTRVINDDFYSFYKEIKDREYRYDVVIGNPPYIRYQFLSEEQRAYQSDILKRNGLKPNKLINAWVAFTVAGIELCKPGGKFGFVLPTDLLQVSYAKDLRKFIFEQLEKVTIINFDGIVFSEVQQDVVLLFGEKRSTNTHENYLRNIYLNNLEDLTNNIISLPFKSYKFDSSDKWRKFLLDEEFLHFYEKDFIKKTLSMNGLADIEVGITTGNNSVFVVDKNTIDKYKLEEYARPLVGRSLDAVGLFYTKEDIQNNSLNGRKVWLLDFNNKRINDSAKKYIKEIESKGEHIGYKLSLRDKWYEVPSIWVPDAFLLRRMGKYPKVVKNEIEATSTDTFHRVKLRDKVESNKLLVLFYSSITLLTFELEGRVFGGGALEILPGDLKNIRLPRLDKGLNYEEISKKVDAKLRNNEDIFRIVEWIDNLIQPYSEFSRNEMNKIRSTWSYLKDIRGD